MILLELPGGIHPVTGTAAMAGRGAAYTVRLYNRARSFRFPWRRKPAPSLLRDILRNAILAELQRTGGHLSDDEIDELVEKVLNLLETAFSGELDVGAIPPVDELLRSSSALAGFLAPLIRRDADLSEARKGMLEKILKENLELRQATVEVE